MWFEFHSPLPATPSAPFIKGTKSKPQDVIAPWTQAPEIGGGEEADGPQTREESRVSTHVKRPTPVSARKAV